MRLRPAVSAALMLAGLVAVPATAHASPTTPASAARPAAATARPVANASAKPEHSVAPYYQNPLQLRLPGGGHAASCADPFELHGQQSGDRRWYLYCTSDALTATELGPDGKPLIHYVPMFTSTDLVHWDYAGDAFPVKPSWITGYLWAPDVVYRDGQYFMYITASDTNLPGGGSAIALATSNSPTGPWQMQDTPVVPPADAANGGGRRWEFDPEVISVGSTSYVYFGSFFGGVHARQLSPDGRTSIASTERQIAIDNRYEGTWIVQRHGWFYFMGSATNCCSGPVTGYAVFVARSRSPLGPFVDQHGVSILAGRVGGTPLLTQNGNRWIGPGHNAVITDYSGQQWIVYHAVDRNDPYYTGDAGYTKRPVLMDPLDWRGEWPVVRGGRGPSDTPQPGPAAQPGERTAYHHHFIEDSHPGQPNRALSDDFDASTLSSQWTWVRQPDQASYGVSGGSLNWQTQNADLHPPATPLASVLTEPAPAGDYVVDTKVSVNVPPEGCCQNYVQGGLAIYGDDGHYIKLATTSIWNTRQTEFGTEISPQPAGYPNYGNSVVGPVGDWTYLRIVHQVRDGQNDYTAYTSLDGEHWDHGATWTRNDLGATPKIGLISLGGAGFTSKFDYVHVSAIAH